MKALTICQPHAHYIWLNEKPVENRSKRTHYRGELAIHAGLSRRWMRDGDAERFPDLVFGAVIAIATLAQCIEYAKLPLELRAHPHCHGPWCWVLADVLPLTTPIPCPGKQGLWNLPADVEALIPERMAA